MNRRPRDLPERRTTIRDAIRRVLAEGFATTREISGRVGITEKDVAGHLEHLARSLKASGERLEIEPAHCLACGFVFKDRARLTTPSRCPRCKDEGIVPPRFHAKPARGAAAD
jgi:predicted Zn-ribbon and HTH transcriptional regulator